jgi:hypothetical protein
MTDDPRRKPYHVPRQRLRRSASGARNPRDAARRLALRCGLLDDGQRAHLTGGPARWLLVAPGGCWRLDLTVQDYQPAPDLQAARQWVQDNLRGLRSLRTTYRRPAAVRDWMDSDGVVVTLDVVHAACRGLHRLEAA